MPYLTELQNTAITVDANGDPILNLPPTRLINLFGPAQEFEQYNVLNDGTPNNTSAGEFIAPVLTEEVDGNTVETPFPGTYLGSGTFGTAALQVGLPPVLGVSALRVNLLLNGVSADYFQAEDGGVYAITGEPLNANNIGVSGSITLGVLPPIPLPANTTLANLNETIAGIPGVGGLLNQLVTQTGSLSQGLLNNVATTSTVDGDGQLLVPSEDIGDLVCFAAGTVILTPGGYRAVETLAVGNLITTKDRGDQPVRWIGARSLSAMALVARPELRAIRIRAGALGAGLPNRDLVVSPQHRVLLRSKVALKMFGTNEVLVAAKQLLQIDGIDIADDLRTITYVHFMFDRHEVVIANGAETESLFTGPQALNSVGEAARSEIFALFPELQDRDYAPEGARLLLSGRMGRKLVSRHIQHDKPLVMNAQR